MARKKKADATPTQKITAEITLQPITETIEKNYMPYVMSVIVSRALPDIDGFKPSHRKLLYTMYKMGLLNGARTKSANVVGQTMHLNPHGDAAIYETLVRLTSGCEALLHPFVDYKGSFGKQYSNMAYAASRYTEVKLAPICQELFSGIDKNAVDMVPNYDNTTTEPTLLPTTFPNILISPNLGIAVGMACRICSFNLGEICDGTIALLKNPNTSVDKMMELIKAPDFPGGGLLIYDREAMRRVFESGDGTLKVRARYQYNAKENSIEVLQIPYSTTVEDIIEKITELVKTGKMKEITDVRDSIDLNGSKLMTIELRRGTDPDRLMAKLYKLTSLEDSFSCNFNVLINGTPRQIGVVEILREWILFRLSCLRRELTYELDKKKDKLHLLLGLATILLDIDKAVRIVRNTEKEEDVVPNLMVAFSIDEIQAEYIAEIKLRHLNREYILNRVQEIENLQADIARLEEILADELKQKALIADQLKEIKKKYGMPRKTQLIGAEDIVTVSAEDFIENYNVRLILTRDGYFKKITLQSLRGNDEQTLKDGDYILSEEETDNLGELVVFTNQARVFKAKVSDFDVTKASALGEFLPARFNMNEGERPILAKALNGYSEKHHIVFLFENGKGVRVSVDNYNAERKKLTSAFSKASPVVAAFYEEEPFDILMVDNLHRAILLSSSIIPEMATKTAGGVTLFTMKKGKTNLAFATRDFAGKYEAPDRYRKKKIPATGILLAENDIKMQQIQFES